MARWQRIWEWPLTIAAVTFLVVYSWLVIADLHGPAAELAQIVLNITWVLFSIDYVGRLILAKQRWSWFLRHLLDLAIVILPMLRPLRLMRLLVLLAVFQRFAGRTLRGRVVVYVAGFTVLLVFVAALAELDAERHEPHSTIRNFGEALWWACSTITTVGYGDAVPVSTTGRLIAVALMISGIALLGTVTATLASWIVQRVAAEDEANQAATRKQVEVLTEQLRELRTPPAAAIDPPTVPIAVAPQRTRRPRASLPGTAAGLTGCHHRRRMTPYRAGRGTN